MLQMSTDKYSKIQVYIVAGSEVYVKLSAKVLLDELRTKYANIFEDYENNKVCKGCTFYWSNVVLSLK